jgi:uncharacterized protein (TIGR02596 family)
MKTSETRAFTIIELIAVISIMMCMVTFVVPAVMPLLRGSQLTGATDQLVGTLTRARQEALTKDNSVEVRFYQYANIQVPGESPNDPSTWKYHALQFFSVDNSGNLKASSKAQLIPNLVIMDSGVAGGPGLSSLLVSGSNIRAQQANGDVPLPRAGADGYSYNYVKFRFLRDGSTDLPT